MISCLIRFFPKPFALFFVNSLIFLGMFFKRFQFVGPRILQITLKATCDHNCIFCSTKRLDLTDCSELNFDDLKKLIDDAISLLIFKLNITSTGEPLLYPKIEELIEYAYRKSHGHMKIKLITNGVHIDKVGIDFFKKYKVDLWLSLHSGEFEVWKMIHGIEEEKALKEFSSLKNNLLKLSKNKSNHVVLHNVLTNKNYLNLDSIYKFAKETKVDEVNFQFVFEFLEYRLDKEETSDFSKIIDSIIKLFEEGGIKHNLYGIKKTMNNFTRKSKKEEKRPPSPNEFYRNNLCYIGWLMAFVDTNGGYKFCLGGNELANIKDRSMKDIIKNEYKSLNKKCVNICKNGMVEEFNCKGCPHISINSVANSYFR